MAYNYTVDKNGNIFKEGRYVDVNQKNVITALNNDPNGISALQQARKTKSGGSGSASGDTPTEDPSIGMSYTPSTFRAPSTPNVSWDDAMARARQQLDPIRTQARNSAGVANQQQMNLLRQKLAAQGNLGDGGYGRALGDMSMQHQENLNNMDSNYGSQLASIAQGITDRDTAATQQAYRDALTMWQMENSMGLQAAQNNRMLDRDAASDQQFGMNYASGLLPYFLMTEAQRQGIPLEWTQLMGQVPGQVQNSNGIDANKLMQLISQMMGG